MKLIEKNQLVGLMYSDAVFRDLYETQNGERVSIETSKRFCVEENRGLSRQEMFEKYKLEK